jgi:glycosyltransferase involved in cell wall biosynthesis
MMSRSGLGFNKYRGITFVGNYLPRRCGIATFTHDLAEAVAIQAGEQQPVSICALNDNNKGYDYPDRVKFEIRQDYAMDYARAADFLNFSRIDVVSLQHEFGIFGGEAGSHILTLLKDLRWPLVVTCHTVTKNPRPAHKEVFIEIAARARKMVVMSQRAVQFMEEIYGIDKSKIVVVPHGIHDIPFIDPSYYKDKFGVEGRRVLLTFGLLNRNKGIEDVLRALPEVVEKHPKVTYVILGATHPAMIRLEGESYRLELQRLVRNLGIEDNVLFHPRFVKTDELLEYLGATDILVTPYHYLDQITSGALSYAMGCGKAVISTPFWHAEELLADGRGRLFPTRDSKALAKEIISLLDDEVTLSTLRKQAYLYCRPMVWPKVARTYLDIFDEVRSHMATTAPVASAVSTPLSAASIPSPKIDHMERLTDNTGPAHYAIRTMPDWTFGYWLSDTASALVGATKFFDIFGAKRSADLIYRYLSLIHFMLNDKETPFGQISYERHPVEEARDDDIGKAIWALGYAVTHGPRLAGEAATDIFTTLVPDIPLSQIRAKAYAILGAANFLTRFPGASAVRRYLSHHTKSLVSFLDSPDWILSWRDVDYGVPVQALAVAAKQLDSKPLAAKVVDLVQILINKTENGKIFMKPGENPDEEELPAIAASFIEAVGAAYYLKPDNRLITALRSAADWFLGVNRRSEALYDFESGGCCDAITASGINQNQGTEATVSCLITFLTLSALAGSPEINRP